MFSGAVKLGGLNDYLGPAQDCVVELLEGTTTEPDEETKIEVKVRDRSELADISADILKGDKPDLIKKKDETSGAKVSLYDCLACSGCVTTAEVMLLEAQSVELFNSALMAKMCDATMEKEISKDVTVNRRVGKIAISISHGSLSAIALYYKINNERKALELLSSFLHSKGVNLTTSQSFGDSGVLLLQKVHNLLNKGSGPFVTSHCPGWVCFAEKSCDKSVLDKIYRYPTGMVIQGAMLKEALVAAETIGLISLGYKPFDGEQFSLLKPEEVFHVAVMPCYDKKLEALRPEFNLKTESEGDIYPLVDLVLGTDELIKWLDQNEFYSYLSTHINFPSLAPLRLCAFDFITKLMPEKGKLYKYEQSMNYYRSFKGCEGVEGSGGMAMTGLGDSSSQKEVEQGINKDFRVITTLESESGIKQIKASMAYGLRNLNNLASYLQRVDYSQLGDLVEAMACPSGCSMGGAHASLLDENNDGEKTTAPTYKNNLDVMRRNSSNGGMTYCYPENHPLVTLWNHYRCIVDDRPTEDFENLAGLYAWLKNLPEFKFISLISEDHQTLDVDW